MEMQRAGRADGVGGASCVAVLAHAEHDLDERAGTDLPAGATPTGC
ncbi:MAG TPA: hypothetical protein VES60_12450 [Nakamurella sp.]|nr:hypothetical protein [Nakamurella sp.]